MQVFKLVRPGFVDRVLAFDELPATVMRGVRRGPIAGFPRHWRDFMGVKHGDTTAMPFYILDYITMNSDKEKWQEISSYVKRNVEPTVRMLDKLEAMAAPLATDSYSDLTLEPEDVPVIPLPKKPEGTTEDEVDEVETKRKRGRPAKVETAA
jgi:hypothetical protein